MEKYQDGKRFSSCLIVVIVLVASELLTADALKNGALTNKERIKFLSTHNQFRSNAAKPFKGKEQPGAGGMKRMFWNAALEAEAIAYANSVSDVEKRKDEHELPYGETLLVRQKDFLDMLGLKRKPWLGQTIGISLTDGQKVVEDWYSEIKDYTYESGSCPTKLCEHYTQIMAENSTYLGCGFGQVEGGQIISVCDYYPGGNKRGTRPYRRAASTCEFCIDLTKDGFTECDNGLCQPEDRCSPVKECRVVDTVNCLCSEDVYKSIVESFLAFIDKIPQKAKSGEASMGSSMCPPSSLILFSAVITLVFVLGVIA